MQKFHQMFEVNIVKLLTTAFTTDHQIVPESYENQGSEILYPNFNTINAINFANQVLHQLDSVLC